MVSFQSPSYFISHTLLGLFVEDKVGPVGGKQVMGRGQEMGSEMPAGVPCLKGWGSVQMWHWSYFFKVYLVCSCASPMRPGHSRSAALS